MIRLKALLTACVILLGAAIGLRADPTPVCPSSGTYASLQALGSCSIGDETFSGFTYSPAGSVPIPSSDLDYMTIDDGLSSIGFLFSLDLTASIGETNGVNLGYTVAGTDIEDAELTMAGVAVGSGSEASIAETICPGGAVASCLSTIPLTTDTTDDSDSVTFAPDGTLGILADADVVGGAGFGSISLFSVTSSEMPTVPEPGTLLLLGTGLLGLAGTIKHKLSS